MITCYASQKSRGKNKHDSVNSAKPSSKQFNEHKTRLLWNLHFHAVHIGGIRKRCMQISLERNCWFVGLKEHDKKRAFCMHCDSSQHLCACNMPYSHFWIVNEKLIWRGSEAEAGVRGAAQGNSKSLHMMRFQLVHYSHCYLCNSGSCRCLEGPGAGERKPGIFVRKRKTRIEALNHNVSIISRWNL